MAINTAINNILSTAAVDAMNEHLALDYFDVVERNNPLQAMFKKSTHGGLDIQQPIGLGEGEAVGADTASVIAGADDVSRGAFKVAWAELMAVGQVANTDIDLMGHDENSVVDALVDSTNKKTRASATRLERNLAGDGFGTLFTIAAHSGSTPNFTLTVSRPTDLAAVQQGWTLVSSAANNSGSLDTGSFTIATIDRDAGTMTVTANSSWSPTDTHVAFARYDKKSGSYSKAICGLGLEFWLPLTAPSTDETSICGMDRRTDVQSLAGVRIDGRNKALYPTVMQALGRLSLNGEAMPNMVAVNASKGWVDLQNSAPPNAFTKEPNGGDFEYGFEVVSFQGPTGKVKVFPCWAIREDRVYVLSKDTWTLHQARDKLFFPDARAGRNGLIDSYNASATQFRRKAIYGLTCAFPGANAVIQTA